MMIESKKGISANQIKRTVKVSLKTAWYLCHRIRAAMSLPDPISLRGTVEVDESYAGGTRRDVGRGNKENKTLVVGAAEREGPIRLMVGDHRDRKAPHG